MSLISGKRRYFYATVANSIFLIHATFALIVLVGWAIPSAVYVYLPVLIAALHYCPVNDSLTGGNRLF